MKQGMIGEWILLWMFRLSVYRLHRRGFWMYINLNGDWREVSSYSLSKSGPPKPQVVVDKTYQAQTGGR